MAVKSGTREAYQLIFATITSLEWASREISTDFASSKLNLFLTFETMTLPLVGPAEYLLGHWLLLGCMAQSAQGPQGTPGNLCVASLSGTVLSAAWQVCFPWPNVAQARVILGSL